MARRLLLAGAVTLGLLALMVLGRYEVVPGANRFGGVFIVNRITGSASYCDADECKQIAYSAAALPGAGRTAPEISFDDLMRAATPAKQRR